MLTEVRKEPNREKSQASSWTGAYHLREEAARVPGLRPYATVLSPLCLGRLKIGLVGDLHLSTDRRSIQAHLPLLYVSGHRVVWAEHSKAQTVWASEIHLWKTRWRPCKVSTP